MSKEKKFEKPPTRTVATTFSIEVRENAAPLQFLAVYLIVATTLAAAIEGAIRRFKIDYPKKFVADHSFQRARH